MEKQEFEQLVTEFAYVIKDTYAITNPNGKYLCLQIYPDSIKINNEFWRDDFDYPIDVNIKTIEGRHARKEKLNDKKG